MKVEVKTGSYNQRRYGKPWIAKVTFETPKGEFHFGDWVGDHYNGSEGLLVLDAEPGDIVATGQKDFRKAQNSAPEWHQVGDDGELQSIGGKAEAYRLFNQKGDQE